MSVYNHDQEESPWAILDPSLKQHYFSKDFSSFKPSYLEYPVSLIQPPSIEEEKKPDHQPESLLEKCTKEINEIESELLHHRNSIYSEKLKILEDELKSIENETHKSIINHDKKFIKTRDKELSRLEALYEYQLEMVEKQALYENQQILEDIKQKTEFARRVVISECSLNNGPAKKRKEVSSCSHSETDETESEIEPKFNFKKIHLKKKIGKLQAISDRQRSSKKNWYDAFHCNDQKDLELDLIKMKKRIGD